MKHEQFSHLRSKLDLETGPRGDSVAAHKKRNIAFTIVRGREYSSRKHLQTLQSR